MGETVDVLVVGKFIDLFSSCFSKCTTAAGNYGTGKRAGGVSTLICAVFDDRRVYEDDEDPK